MALVTSLEILLKAKNGGYAVGAFNANNLECIQAVIETANEEKAPVILQISQGAIKYAGLQQAAGMVRFAAELVDVPVVLHLDHGTSFEQNIICLKAGFTSLMFDGSLLPLEENMKITKKIADVAHACNIPVEAELGRVGGSEEGLAGETVDELKANPDDAERFVKETTCDSLAIAIGSVHRMKQKEAQLDIELIKKIKAKVNIPFVLHGASGVNEDSLKEAVKNGICKVNVATQINMALLRGISAGLKEMPEEADFRKIFLKGKNEVKEIVRHYIRLLGCSGKA